MMNWAADRHGEVSADQSVLDPAVVRRLWVYLEPHKPKLLLNVFLIVVSAATQIISPLLLMIAIDDFLIARRDMVGLTIVSAAFLVTQLVSWSAQSHQFFQMALIAQDVLNQM